MALARGEVVGLCAGTAHPYALRVAQLLDSAGGVGGAGVGFAGEVLGSIKMCGVWICSGRGKPPPFLVMEPVNPARIGVAVVA